MTPRPACTPITVALVDDYDVVVLGLAKMLDSYRDRVVIAEIDTNQALHDTVDVVLYDSFAQPEADHHDIGAAHGILGNDARFLVLDLLGLSTTELILHGDRPLGTPDASRLEAGLARRLSGEPVARIVGAWEFWGLPFGLCPETLVPRADTETLARDAEARGWGSEVERHRRLIERLDAHIAKAQTG